MNHDVDKYITKLTVMGLKTIINECLREFEEEKRRATYAGLEKAYRQMWIKTSPNPPPIETETMPPQCQKPPILPKVLNAGPIETERPKHTTYEFYAPPWRYSKP